MRVLRLLPFVLIFSTPVLAQTTPQAQGDPQAIAVVQAAIKALGGATAIAQPQQWTFQADMQGLRANGSVKYIVSTDKNTGIVHSLDGTTVPALPIHSYFVPALAASILLEQSQDPNFSIRYGGISQLNSGSVVIIVFYVGRVKFPAQIWSFDNVTHMPSQVDFRMPAIIGARMSFHGVVSLSDYRNVSGVFYPFRLVSPEAWKPPEIVTLQSVVTDSAATQNIFNGLAGDLP
jgi:hypothetical protein